MPEPGGGEFNPGPPKGEKQEPYVAERPGRNFYTILGVTKEGLAADKDLLKRKYRELAERYHPSSTHVEEHGPDDEERFKDVSEAYNVLRDPVKSWDYRQGYGTFIDTDHPERPYIPRDERSPGYYYEDSPDDSAGSDSYGNAGPNPAGEYTDTSQEAKGDQEAPPEAPPPWWKGFNSEYDNFYFEEKKDKTTKSGRNRTERPHRKSEKIARQRIDEAAERRLKSKIAEAHREYNKDGSVANFYARVHAAEHISDRRYHQEAKYGIVHAFGERANATEFVTLETAAIDKLVGDGHNSMDPKIYWLPDGTYLRVASYWEMKGDHKEDTTRIEHITGEKDEQGYFHSKGIELVKEGKNGPFFMRRITRPYNLDLLDQQHKMNSLQFYLNVGFGGPYQTVLTEGAIKGRELKQYMAMLQQATVARQERLEV